MTCHVSPGWTDAVGIVTVSLVHSTSGTCVSGDGVPAIDAVPVGFEPAIETDTVNADDSVIETTPLDAVAVPAEPSAVARLDASRPATTVGLSPDWTVYGSEW